MCFIYIYIYTHILRTRKDIPHVFIPTLSSPRYAPHYRVLPYIPLQPSIYSVHCDVLSDGLHWLTACFCWFLAWLLTLKMEEIYPSEI
jgi:hypothetical protein